VILKKMEGMGDRGKGGERDGNAEEVGVPREKRGLEQGGKGNRKKKEPNERGKGTWGGSRGKETTRTFLADGSQHLRLISVLRDAEKREKNQNRSKGSKS